MASSAPDPNEVSGVRILHIGGHPPAAERVRSLLEASSSIHCEARHARRVSQALGDPEAKAADAILLDLENRGRGGLEDLTQIRLRLPQVPVIVLAETDDEDLASRVLKLGARGFLLHSELNVRLLSSVLQVALVTQRTVQQLSDARERQVHLGTHDQLTGMANRTLFKDRLEQALAAARRTNKRVAVLYLDLDGLKAVNDSLGHAVGDGMLRGIARQMGSCLRECDTAARLGGDEFAVVLTQLNDELDASIVAGKILESLRRPILFRGRSHTTTASIGIATFPRDAARGEELVSKADTAMYHAKRQGGDRFEFYTRDMTIEVRRRAALESRLRVGLRDREFRVYYQPQFDLRLGRIVGAEALLRWEHPELGMLVPGQFLQLASETRLIVPIGEWVLTEACQQLASWRKAGHRGLRMSVNVAPQQFQADGFVTMVGNALSEHGIDAHSLELEITEGHLLEDVECTVRTLHALKALEVRLAVDDFGTGYSSLAYLKRLPIDVLKVDQSFVRGIATDPADSTITKAVLELANGLGLTAVAEGVETVEQLLTLGSMGCHRLQGFLFGEAAPAERFEQWLVDPPFQWTVSES